MTDLFDDVFEGQGPEQKTLNVAEAFMAIALAVVTADGHFSNDEKDWLSLSLRRMPIFHAYTLDQLRNALEKTTKLLAQENLGTLIGLAKETLNSDYRETALYFATDLALADGLLHNNEKSLLNRLQQDLEINRDTALKIIEVVLIKNRR